MQTLGMGVHCAPAKAWCFLHSKGKASAYSLGGKIPFRREWFWDSEEWTCAVCRQFSVDSESPEFLPSRKHNQKAGEPPGFVLGPCSYCHSPGNMLPDPPHLITLQRNLHPFQRRFVHSFLLPPWGLSEIRSFWTMILDEKPLYRLCEQGPWHVWEWMCMWI